MCAFCLIDFMAFEQLACRFMVQESSFPTSREHLVVMLQRSLVEAIGIVACQSCMQRVRCVYHLVGQSISCANSLVMSLPVTRQRDTNTLSLIFSDVDHDERDLRDCWGLPFETVLKPYSCAMLVGNT